MDAPRCKLCQKRHYGQCAVAKAASPPGKKSNKAKVSQSDSADPFSRADDRSLDDTSVVIPAGTKLVVGDFKLPDVCPECGTNLAAQRKSRERRRAWMKRKRAAEKGSSE